MPEDYKIKWYGRDVMVKATAANVTAMKKAVVIVEADVKKHFPKIGTGRTYKYKGRSHIASAAGQPPAVMTGKLKSSVQSKVKKRGDGVIGRVGTDVPYGLYLEKGSPKTGMKARPFLAPALKRTQGKIDAIFKGANS